MQPHQQRVIDEKVELDKKISGLSMFMEKPGMFGGLPELERMRLFAQRRVMVEYSNILGERIAAF
jgi:hypothetical protein